MGTPIIKIVMLLTLTACLLNGCGYYNPNAATLKERGPVTIYIPMWKNQTNELGLEATFHQALHDWFAESRFIHIANSAAEADYVLDGVILAINIPGLSYGSYDQAKELRAELKVRFSMKDRKSAALVMPSREMTKRESFPTGADAPHSRTNKEEALALILNELSEDIYINVTGTLTRQKTYK